MSQKTSNIPVILIHRGKHDYVQTCINQAKFYNKTVIVISDSEYENCDNVDILGYTTHADEFRKYYTPLSTLGDYELFCFLRWFILYEYMTKENIDDVFYIDSDVLLYHNISDDKDFFKNYIFTLILRSVGCTSYFTTSGLKMFCKFLFEIYQKKDSYEFAKIASHYKVRQEFNLPGGVCDMTLFEYFARYKCSVGVGELSNIHNDTTYDHNINDSDNMYEFDGIKKIEFIDKKPYCYSPVLDKKIQFKSIHFQGGSKHLMDQYKTYE